VSAPPAWLHRASEPIIRLSKMRRIRPPNAPKTLSPQAGHPRSLGPLDRLRPASGVPCSRSSDTASPPAPPTAATPTTALAALYRIAPVSSCSFAAIPLSCATSSQCVSRRRCRYATDRWRGDALAALLRLRRLRPARTNCPAPAEEIALSRSVYSRGIDDVVLVLLVARRRSRDAANDWTNALPRSIQTLICTCDVHGLCYLPSCACTHPSGRYRR